MAQKTYTNQFGRRAGRGIRPWLLMPKVLAVAVYFGGLAGAVGVWFFSGYEMLSPADPRRLWTIELVSRLLRFLVVPALLLAMGLGVGLLLQHPREFLRLRWLRVKLVGLLIVIPSAHFYLSAQLALLREACRRQIDAPTAYRQFTWGLVAALIASAAVIVLARLKPRLGQKIARAAREQTPASDPAPAPVAAERD